MSTNDRVWNSDDEETGLDAPISPQKHREIYYEWQQNLLQRVIKGINQDLRSLELRPECPEASELDDERMDVLRKHYRKYGWKVGYSRPGKVFIITSIEEKEEEKMEPEEPEKVCQAVRIVFEFNSPREKFSEKDLREMVEENMLDHTDFLPFKVYIGDVEV